MEVGSSSLPGTTSHLLSPAGGLAQLARAPALQAGGQRFESVILHHSEVDFSSSFRKEIFDILTHKTVSKDFVQVKKENKSQKTAESKS